MAKALAREEVRARLSRLGKSISDVANELHVDRTVVRGVLFGRLKGTRGDAHKVAVALGLKDGLIVGENVSLTDAIEAAAR